MKYAFMTFSCPELSLTETLSLAKKTGYDGIEPRITAEHAHGIEVDINADARSAIASEVKASGVEMSCIATSCKFADPEEADQNVEHCHEAIDLAADLGSPAIRVFGGQIGGGLSRDAATELVASSLGRVADHAADRKVVICMETHDDWCKPEHVADIMRRVGSEYVAVNWDIMHPVRTRQATMEESYATLKQWIRHVHVHDASLDEDGNPSLEFAPIGTGYVDHKTAISLLAADGYRGAISGEWINWADPYEVHLPRELQTLKGFEA